MKFIHTADWHLGKLFYGRYLTEEQDWILKEKFLPLLDEEEPDAVILAGDVYDRSVPPAEAVSLFDEMVSEIVLTRKIPFLVISGNHDSPERLSFGSSLLAGAGLYVCGDIGRTVRPIFLSDEFGEVAFCPLPFAESADIRAALGDENLRERGDALRALSDWLSSQIPEGTRKIAVAHDFIAGGTPSESERPLSIGGEEMVPADIFAGYDYTALGHLHGPQKAGSDIIRYSGSLLKYSFGEADQKKGVIVGTIDGEGNVTTEFRPLTPRHDVRIIRGLFDDLMTREEEAPEDFLLADLLDPRPVIDAMARLRAKYPNMMKISTNFGIREDSGERAALHERVDMLDIWQAFSEKFAGRPLSDEEIDFMNGIRRELEAEE